MTSQPPVARAEGAKSLMRLTETHVEIERYGGWRTHHGNKTMRIPIDAVVGVRYKEPEFLVPGFLRVETAAAPPMTNVGTDEFLVHFGKSDSHPFRLMRDAIQAATSAQRRVDPLPVDRRLGITDELMKLARLRDDGAISDIEFATLKAKLMS